MPVKPGPNPDALALNAAWKRQQARLTTTTQQKPAIDVHHDVITAKPMPVIHPDTPKTTGETPAECKNCVVVKECKSVLKLWYKKKPRPQLVQAWVRLVDEHAAEMVCLSKIQTPQDNRFSLRRDK